MIDKKKLRPIAYAAFNICSSVTVATLAHYASDWIAAYIAGLIFTLFTGLAMFIMEEEA